MAQPDTLMTAAGGVAEVLLSSRFAPPGRVELAALHIEPHESLLLRLG